MTNIEKQQLSDFLKNGSSDICDCHCHQEGAMVKHCCPCCDLTYEKYIKENGEIDIEKYEKLKNNLKE